MPTIEFLGKPLDAFYAAIAFILLAQIVGFLLSLWIAYFVMKMAIRDGINESGLVNSWTHVVTASKRTNDTHRTDLGDMRADR